MNNYLNEIKMLEVDKTNSDILKTELIDILIKENKNEEINHTMTFDANGSGLLYINDDIKTEKEDLIEELNWYYSLSPYVTNPSKRMKKWKSEAGLSNSNYGFIVFSSQNGLQFENIVNELRNNKNSRRAVINYTHPFIQYVGKYDFICTQYVNYFIRDNKLNCLVSMRSNDIVSGLIYCDFFWQLHVLKLIAKELSLDVDKMYWHSTNIHLYEEDLIKIKGKK